MDWFWLSLTAKMATSAVVVVTASLVAERAGPVLGALVATLPVSTGPAYAFIASEHGPAFLAETTLASLGANAATAIFVFVYAAAAQRHGVLASLGSALGVWVVAAILLTELSLSFVAGLLVNLLAFGAALVLTRPFRQTYGVAPVRRRWWDVPMRAGMVMAIVAAVVLAGRWLGPTAAGVAALLPVTLTSLILVLHSRIGGPGAATVLANSIPGLIGFTAGLATVHLTVIALGSLWSLLLALSVCVAWNAGLLAFNLRARGRLASAGRT